MPEGIIRVLTLHGPRNVYEVGRGGVREITQGQTGEWIVDKGRHVTIVTGDCEAEGVVKLASPVARVQERVAHSNAKPGKAPSQKRKAVKKATPAKGAQKGT